MLPHELGTMVLLTMLLGQTADTAKPVLRVAVLSMRLEYLRLCREAFTKGDIPDTNCFHAARDAALRECWYTRGLGCFKSHTSPKKRKTQST